MESAGKSGRPGTGAADCPHFHANRDNLFDRMASRVSDIPLRKAGKTGKVSRNFRKISRDLSGTLRN
jgi:hypothetical protein